jgi:hypothetical protein
VTGPEDREDGLAEPRRDQDHEPGRPMWDDQRADYDDEFEHLWTPWELARRRAIGPAIAFVVIGPLGILGMIVAAVALLAENLDRALAGNTTRFVNIIVGLVSILLGMVLFTLVIAGGVNMMRLRRRWLALFAAYVVTGLSVAGCYAILFYPFGIWGLIVLYRPEVREQFGRQPQPRDDSHGEL